MSTRQYQIFYLLLLGILLTPFRLWMSLKPLPTLILFALLFVNAVLSWMTDHPARERLSGRLLVGFVGCSLVGDVALLAMQFAPPITADGHPVMPVGQLAAGLAVGSVSTVALAYFYFVKGVRDNRLEKIVLSAALVGVVAKMVVSFVRYGTI